MKKYIILIVIIVLGVMAAVTCPDCERHKQVVKIHICRKFGTDFVEK